MSELKFIFDILIAAKLSKSVHPDKHNFDNKLVSEEAFKKLNYWYEIAEKRIMQGVYGTDKTTNEPIMFHTKTGEYIVDSAPIFVSDMYTIYHATLNTKKVLFKITNKPKDNDLLLNESETLKFLHSDDTFRQWYPYVVELVDTFVYTENGVNRRTNILSYQDNLFSLEKVKERYPSGIDAKDMAWMFRRVLVALDYIHSMGVIHGSLTPSSILVEPEQHGIVLIDWVYATKGTPMKAIDNKYSLWYPKEVRDKEIVSPETDIAVVAKTMIWLINDFIPKELVSFFRACMFSDRRMRPKSTTTLLKDFDQVISMLWGPRVFRPFTMGE